MDHLSVAIVRRAGEGILAIRAMSGPSETFAAGHSSRN